MPSKITVLFTLFVMTNLLSAQRSFHPEGGRAGEELRLLSQSFRPDKSLQSTQEWAAEREISGSSTSDTRSRVPSRKGSRAARPVSPRKRFAAPLRATTRRAEQKIGYAVFYPSWRQASGPAYLELLHQAMFR